MKNNIMEFDFNNIPTLYYQVALSALAIIFFFIARGILQRIVRSRANKMNIDVSRIGFTMKIFNILLIFALLTIVAIIWDVSFRGLSIYFASLFAVIGVAFFAQWSLISNVTAAIILFFNYSYDIGSRIKVLDGDNSVEGKIVDIELFYFHIETDAGEIVAYPNNLILQKPIIQLDQKGSKGTKSKKVKTTG